MTQVRRWTRSELIATILLYVRTPFGRLHKNNPDIIELAHHLQRTPSAVALKLCNFAALDPSLDRIGMQNFSALDKQVWAEVQNDWSLLQQWQSEVEVPSELAEHAAGYEVERLVRQRRGQDLFRRMVLSGYNHRCAMTGLSQPSLLIASHIKPWAEDEVHRLNPHNGICLNALHDKAFDRGLITVDKKLRVILSTELQHSELEPEQHFFQRYAGAELIQPRRFCPDVTFLEYHRQQIFIG